MTTRTQIGLGLAVAALIAAAIFSTQLMETVDSGETMVLQDPVDGDLHVHSSAGMKWQGFGKVTKYSKSETLWFSDKDGSCTKNTKNAIKTRFNDGAHGWVCGSLRYELPTDEKSMKALHRIYGSDAAIVAQLVDPVIQKSIYMSGPLLSSKESYAERRTDLIQFIKDQTERGVYQTRTESRRVSVNELGITGEASATSKFKTVDVAVIALDAGGMPLRQEVTKARATTLAEQEKSVAVTRAEKVKAVALLERDAAKLEKERQILLGEGEARRKQLAMAADGALTQKLNAWVKVNGLYAEQLGKQRWVPNIVMGGNSGGSGGAQGILDLFMVKTAKELNLDLKMKATK